MHVGAAKSSPAQSRSSQPASQPASRISYSSFPYVLVTSRRSQTGTRPLRKSVALARFQMARGGGGRMSGRGSWDCDGDVRSGQARYSRLCRHQNIQTEMPADA